MFYLETQSPTLSIGYIYAVWHIAYKLNFSCRFNYFPLHWLSCVLMAGDMLGNILHVFPDLAVCILWWWYLLTCWYQLCNHFFFEKYPAELFSFMFDQSKTTTIATKNKYSPRTWALSSVVSDFAEHKALKWTGEWFVFVKDWNIFNMYMLKIWTHTVICACDVSRSWPTGNNWWWWSWVGYACLVRCLLTEPGWRRWCQCIV